MQQDEATFATAQEERAEVLSRIAARQQDAEAELAALLRTAQLRQDEQEKKANMTSSSTLQT